MASSECRRVFTDRFPSSLVSVVSLLRRRVRCSREVADDVVRARGYIKMNMAFIELFEEQRFFDNIRHGLGRAWYKNNGAPHWETTYVNGKRHGLERVWYANGTLGQEIAYSNDERHGLARWWSEEGTLLHAIVYCHGGYATRNVISSSTTQDS